jgi:hypothetical protein
MSNCPSKIGMRSLARWTTTRRKERYECAFCSERTSDDPRWVRMSLHWERSVGWQQIGAHFACLQAALRPGFPLYDGLG